MTTSTKEDIDSFLNYVQTHKHLPALSDFEENFEDLGVELLENYFSEKQIERLKNELSYNEVIKELNEKKLISPAEWVITRQGERFLTR